MLANCAIASTETRVPSLACQCAIHASSAANGSGSPLRSRCDQSFSVIDAQFSMPGPSTGHATVPQLVPESPDRIEVFGTTQVQVAMLVDHSATRQLLA
jgi:hypothetical protein